MERPGDPYGAFNFLVEIEGVTQAGFSEASGLESHTDVIEYREGGDTRLRRLPGITRYSNIVLKRGWSGSTELFDWRKAVTDGQTERKAMSIILLDESRQEVSRWNAYEAWPVAWEGPHLNAAVSGVAIERLEIGHERLELA